MLDAKFGVLLSPQRAGAAPSNVYQWERDFAPASLALLDTDPAASLKKLMLDISNGWKLGKVIVHDLLIIWLVDAVGGIWFALEELVCDGIGTERPRHQTLGITSTQAKLGHPALINCSAARIAGEIYFDYGASDPSWIINNKSGRYGRDTSRTKAHLESVVLVFDGYGIKLSPDFFS
jgi:hypothetical protein